jgi:hypothetical protein
MKVFLAIIIVGIAVAIGVWALTKLIETIYNIKALRDDSLHPDASTQKQGIVYNKDTKKLEADQSTITPF